MTAENLMIRHGIDVKPEREVGAMNRYHKWGLGLTVLLAGIACVVIERQSSTQSRNEPANGSVDDSQATPFNSTYDSEGKSGRGESSPLPVMEQTAVQHSSEEGGNIPEETSIRVPPREHGPAGNGGQFGGQTVSYNPISPEHMAAAGETEILYEYEEGEEIELGFSPVDDKAGLADWEILDMVEEGGDDNLMQLIDVLRDTSVDTETKQDVLANMDSLFEEREAEYIAFLSTLIVDEQQPDDVRVDALRKLSDYDEALAFSFKDYHNEEISSEVDLLMRIDLYEKQNAAVE